MPVLLNATIFANPYPKFMQLSLYGNYIWETKGPGPSRVGSGPGETPPPQSTVDRIKIFKLNRKDCQSQSGFVLV